MEKKKKVSFTLTSEPPHPLIALPFPSSENPAQDSFMQYPTSIRLYFQKAQTMSHSNAYQIFPLD